MADIDINDPERNNLENGGMAAPSIPQPQMPTTQLRDGVREAIGTPTLTGGEPPMGAYTVGADGNRDGGRNVYYGSKVAHYDSSGNITGWYDSQTNKRIDAPASASMVGGADYGRGGAGDAVKTAQGFARQSDEDRQKQKAAYNREVGIAMSGALQRAFNDGNEPVKLKDGSSYLMGKLNSAEISALNDKLRAMGKHTIEKAGVFQNVDATGRASGDPQFVIRFKQDGARNTAGKSFVRNLSKAEFMETMRGAFDALGQSGEVENFEKAMFRDYQAENQKRKQDEENRKLELREREAKIAKIESDAEGTIAKAFGVEGMGREGIARAVSQNPNAATSKIMELVPKLYDQFKTTNEQLTEDDGKGNKIPVTTKDGLPMYKQLSHEETMERVYNAINNLTGSNIVTERMKKMETLKAIREAKKNAAQSPAAVAQPAPQTQTPTSPNFTDLSAPTQGAINPTNTIGNLAQQTFGSPSGNAPTVAQPAPQTQTPTSATTPTVATNTSTATDAPGTFSTPFSDRNEESAFQAWYGSVDQKVKDAITGPGGDNGDFNFRQLYSDIVEKKFNDGERHISLEDAKNFSSDKSMRKYYREGATATTESDERKKLGMAGYRRFTDIDQLRNGVKNSMPDNASNTDKLIANLVNQQAKFTEIGDEKSAREVAEKIEAIESVLQDADDLLEEYGRR